MVRVEIVSFAIDPRSGLPLVILREVGGERSLAVPIEAGDARAIAMHTLQVRIDKPSAVDLVKIVIEQLGAVFYRVVITDVSDNAFSSCIIVHASGGAVKVIDCMPPTAIVLAVKGEVPMYVKEAVFSKLSDGRGLTEEERLRAGIRSVDAVEFGRYILE